MADLYEEVVDWSLGVLANIEPDLIPKNATPQAWNTSFKSIGVGVAVLGTRPGLTLINPTPIAGTPVLHFMHQYNYDDGTQRLRYLAILGNDGSLYYKLVNETLTAELVPPANFPFTSGQAFAIGDARPDATVMSNRLFLTSGAGERRSLLNQTFEMFGKEPIVNWLVTAVAGGTSGMPAETYDVTLTTYDDDTGAESSQSASLPQTVTLAANGRIQITIAPTAAEIAQNEFWRVYIRRQTTQANLLRVLTLENIGGATIVTDGNIPIGTTTVYVDLSAAQIAALVLIAPSVTENNPPADSIKYLETYGRRLITADDNKVYWSQIDKPDAFPPANFEPIETGEGDKITGLKVYTEELLLVYTTNGLWGVYGNDPQTWVFRKIDQTVGLESHTSISDMGEGRVAWWSPQVGPVQFDGGTVLRIGLEKLGEELVIDSVERTRADFVTAGYDAELNDVVWVVSSAGNASRNDIMVPFNWRLNQFEATRWDPMDAASLQTGFDVDGRERLYLGGYEGQLFKFDKAVKNDGVVSGTKQGTFVATGTTQTNITDLTATFDVVGGGLIERKIVIVDADLKPIGKYRISANTATVLTTSQIITDLQTGNTYTYYIGGPDFRLFSKWFDMGVPFERKRYDRIYIHARSEGDSTSLAIGTAVSFIEDTVPVQQELSISGSLWDEGIWDSATWAGAGSFKRRLGVWRNGTAVRIAILHHEPDKDVTVMKIAVLARELSDRYLV